jgi:hypothetical protein
LDVDGIGLLLGHGLFLDLFCRARTCLIC